eukprot:26963_1
MSSSDEYPSDVDEHISNEYIRDSDPIHTSEEIAQYNMRSRNEDARERKAINDGYNYNSGCSSRCIDDFSPKQYRCSSESCRKWACVYHLHHKHQYKFAQQTLRMCDGANFVLPDAVNALEAYNQLCNEDVVFRGFERNKWICTDCIDSLIEATNNVSKYVDIIRKEMYNTELSFSSDTKHKERPIGLKKDPDLPWSFICMPLLLHQVAGKRDNIDIMLGNQTWLHKGEQIFYNHYDKWKRKLAQSPYSDLLNHSLKQKGGKPLDS